MGDRTVTTTRPSTGEFGRLLREFRTRARLSQEQHAHAAGVSVRALTDMERGRTRGPQRRTVQALTRALELSTADSEQLERAAGIGRPRPRPAIDPAPPGILPLPRDISDFTARGPALARILALAESMDAAHPPVVVSGQPGLVRQAERRTHPRRTTPDPSKPATMGGAPSGPRPPRALSLLRPVRTSCPPGARAGCPQTAVRRSLQPTLLWRATAASKSPRPAAH